MNYRWVSLVVLVCSVIVAIYPYAPQAQESSNKHAILIGIDDYLYTDPLKGQKTDVARMRQFLIDHRAFSSRQIITLVDEEATHDNIEKVIVGLQNSTLPNDIIFIYFAGHGFQVGDNNSDETDDGMDEVIMPYDATTIRQSILSSNQKARLAYKNMIRDDDLNIWLDALADRQVEVLIDACHSGTITRSAGLTFGDKPSYLVKQSSTINSPDGQPHSVLTAPIQLTSDGLRQSIEQKSFVTPDLNRKVWTAASAKELAYVDRLYSGKNTEGSVFTHYFIRGVADLEADKNADDKVTDAELIAYLRQKSEEYCSKNPSCIRLYPTLSVTN